MRAHRKHSHKIIDIRSIRRTRKVTRALQAIAREIEIATALHRIDRAKAQIDYFTSFLAYR